MGHTGNFTMAKALAEHPDWCSWLQENIRRGCDHTVLVETLLKNGFDPASIRNVLDGRAAFARQALPNPQQTPQTDYDRQGLTAADGPFLVSQVLTQKLQLYKHEFENGGNKAKSGYVFSFEVINGKVVKKVCTTSVAGDLVQILDSSSEIKSWLKDRHVKFSMEKTFELQLEKVVS